MQEEEPTRLSGSQEIVLSLLTTLSGALSFFGSSVIVLLIASSVANGSSQLTAYKRIMLGLSFFDGISSLNFALQPFFVPAHSGRRVWAIGTEATCTILGAGTQFAVGALVYSACLSVYHLLCIRYGVSSKTFSERYEIYFHSLAIIYSIVTAAVGVALGIFGELDLGINCWVSEFPRGCNVNGGCTGPIFGWFFAGIPWLLSFITVVISNCIIYRRSRKVLGEFQQTVKSSKHRTRDLSDMEHEEDGDGSHHQPDGPESAQLESNQGNKSSHGQNRISPVRTEAFTNAESQSNRIRIMSSQALLYIGCFFVVYIWVFFVRVFESLGYHRKEDEVAIYPLLVLQAIFLPMQGFLNMIVYTRPSYLDTRNEFPEESRLWCVFRAWLGPDRVFPTVHVAAVSENSLID